MILATLTCCKIHHMGAKPPHLLKPQELLEVQRVRTSLPGRRQGGCFQVQLKDRSLNHQELCSRESMKMTFGEKERKVQGDPGTRPQLFSKRPPSFFNVLGVQHRYTGDFTWPWVSNQYISDSLWWGLTTLHGCCSQRISKSPHKLGLCHIS